MRFLEERVTKAAEMLADAEAAFSQEVLLLVAGGRTTWDAQHMAEVRCGRTRHLARAAYELALDRLRRA